MPATASCAARRSRRRSRRDERREILRGMVLTRATDNRLKTLLHRRRSPLRRRAVPGQRLPLARPGSDLRRRDPPAPRRRVSRRRRHAGTATSSRRHPRSRRRRSRCVREPRDGADGPERADGQGRPADGRQGPARRRLRAGASCRRRRRSRSATLTIAGHGDGVLRATDRGRVARLVHRRRRIVARRMARSDQPLRRAAAAGDLLRPEQPDRALDAGRANSRAVRVFADKAAGYGIPGITIDGTDPDADRRGVRVGGRARARRRRPGADRARRRCACAATRITTTCSISARIRSRRGTYPPLAEQRLRRTASCTSTGRRAIRSRRYAARLEAEGVIDAGDLERIQARGRGARRSAGARGHRRAVARRRSGRRRRVRRRAAARARRGARPGVRIARRQRPALPPRRSRRRRSIRRAARFSKRSCSASATRCAPIRACSSTAKTSAASTATRSCCCGRC